MGLFINVSICGALHAIENIYLLKEIFNNYVTFVLNKVDHYSIYRVDMVEGHKVDEALRGLLPGGEESHFPEPICKFQTDCGLKGIKKGILGIEDKFYEFKGEGVVRVSEPILIPGRYAAAVFLYGFDQDNETYKKLIRELERLGFEKQDTRSDKELGRSLLGMLSKED